MVLPEKCNITFFRSLQISEGPTLNVSYIFEGADCMGFSQNVISNVSYIFEFYLP